MPLRHILEFAQLRARGNGTIAQRQRMLEAHAEHLEAAIAVQQQHLKRLREKIDHYRSLAQR